MISSRAPLLRLVFFPSRRRLPGLLVLIGCLGMMSGCGGDEHEDVKQWMNGVSRDLRGRVPPLPELKPFPVVSYDAAGQLDPFSPGRVEAEKKDGGGNKPDFDRPREQLENFPLESLSYVGVVSKDKNAVRRALIQVDGVVYQVGKGSYLGQNFGRIVAVNDSELVLMETVRDPSGQSSDWMERQMTLQLQDASQGKEAAK